MPVLLRFMILERGPAARAARWGGFVTTILALYAGTGVYLMLPGATDLDAAHTIHYLAVPVLVLAAVVALVAYGVPVTLARAFGGPGGTEWAHLGVFAGAAAGVMLAVMSPRITQGAWEAMLARVMADHPLPAAVHAYEARHGHLPASLDEVAPHPAALHTIRGCRPLRLAPGAGRGAWSLTAECPSGLIVAMDRLEYRADPAAPLQRGEVKVGRWRYFYD